MRSFVFGLVLLIGISFTVLSLRPGGLRQQLRLAGRRLRLVIVLGGVYVIVSTVARLAFHDGPIIDYGLPALAIALAVIFLIIGRDPVPPIATPAKPR